MKTIRLCSSILFAGHLPGTHVAGLVLVRGATNAAANAIYILITLGAMLRKVDARPEHTPNVGVTLVKSALYDRIDERTAVEQHAFIGLQEVLFGNLLTSMRIAFPQFTILNLLHLQKGLLIYSTVLFSPWILYPHDIIAREVTTSLAIVTMFTYCGLHFLFHGNELLVIWQQIDQQRAQIHIVANAC